MSLNEVKRLPFYEYHLILEDVLMNQPQTPSNDNTTDD